MVAGADKALAWLGRNRRRLAPLLLLGAALAVGKLFTEQSPRKYDVELVLSPAQQRATQVAITYTQEGEAVLGVRFNYPEGAPDRVVHAPSLRAGRYNVAIELLVPGQPSEHIARPLDVPFEGTTRLRLSEPE